jgi:DnaJ-class molecular chaperone
VTSEEIRKSFKKLAAQWHPDKNSESEEMREHAEHMFKDINEAYNLLSDAKKRKIYDDGGHPDDPNSVFHSSDFNSAEKHDVFSEYFGTQSQDTNSNSKTREKNYSNKKYDIRERSRERSRNKSKSRESSLDSRKKSRQKIFNRNKNYDKKYK